MGGRVEVLSFFNELGLKKKFKGFFKTCAVVRVEGWVGDVDVEVDWRAHF